MDRRSALTSLFALAMLVGCSGAPDVEEETDVASTASELKKCEGDNDHECDCDGPSRKKAYRVMAFNPTSGQISGVNGFGQTFSAQITDATRFRVANLSRFSPQDPVRPAIIQYNSLVAQGDKTHAALLLTQGLTIRAGIKNGLVKSLRPVPSS